ncbi:MAG: DegQ family serine endoprotease [Gammaproteobacteria bacterium]|nr:DegQ family serine endoprotease [Gammaproteobacteria bacterium]
MNTFKASRFIVGLFLLAIGQVLFVSAQARSLPDFTELVENYGAAVVNISTTQKIKQQRPVPRAMPKDKLHKDQDPQAPFGDLFKHFFGEEGEEIERFGNQSLGSGFIISEDGYVLTNYHVTKGAEEIIVRLVDRRQLTAKVIGSDKRSDLALLKVDAKNLPVVKIGRSDKLKVGAWVLAIGSPFGFDHSVTAGIVSAKGRSLPRENYVPFIQTDVAINPGNSGGPLFNLEGEVVGINSQIYSRTGGFMGLSFAIPIDMVMDVVDQLKSSGHVSRGWLGVLIQDVTRELAESFGMKTPKGALVAKVLPDSPAEKAGFQVGDVIVKFNGKDVSTSSSLPPIVGVTKVNKAVDTKVIRNGKSINIEVTIGELPAEDELRASNSSGSKATTDGRIGVIVADLTAEQREKLELKKNGILVQAIKNGPASKAGVRKGDIILMINNEQIKDVSHFKEIVKGLKKDKSVPILVQRRGGPVFLALKVTED